MHYDEYRRDDSDELADLREARYHRRILREEEERQRRIKEAREYFETHNEDGTKKGA